MPGWTPRKDGPYETGKYVCGTVWVQAFVVRHLPSAVPKPQPRVTAIAGRRSTKTCITAERRYVNIVYSTARKHLGMDADVAGEDDCSSEHNEAASCGGRPERFARLYYFSIVDLY